jgi:hypothetical protein
MKPGLSFAFGVGFAKASREPHPRETPRAGGNALSCPFVLDHTLLGFSALPPNLHSRNMCFCLAALMKHPGETTTFLGNRHLQLFQAC